jgi:hypothetical protein
MIIVGVVFLWFRIGDMGGALHFQVEHHVQDKRIDFF